MNIVLKHNSGKMHANRVCNHFMENTKKSEMQLKAASHLLFSEGFYWIRSDQNKGHCKLSLLMNCGKTH